jgi:hypothetical protein
MPISSPEGGRVVGQSVCSAKNKANHLLFGNFCDEERTISLFPLENLCPDFFAFRIRELVKIVLGYDPGKCRSPGADMCSGNSCYVFCTYLPYIHTYLLFMTFETQWKQKTILVSPRVDFLSPKHLDIPLAFPLSERKIPHQYWCFFKHGYSR